MALGPPLLTLELARLAAESIHGAERVELDAVSRLDPSARRVTIDTSARPGHTLAERTAGTTLGLYRTSRGRQPRIAATRYDEVAPARLKVTDRLYGTVNVAVSVEEVSGTVVRLLSMRPLPVGTTAELTNRNGTWTGRVSRCHRAMMTGLYELSVALDNRRATQRA